MSRNAISANPEHYIFKIVRGACHWTPLESLKKFFSPPHVSKIFFRIDFPQKQKILDRTLTYFCLFCLVILFICEFSSIRNHKENKVSAICLMPSLPPYLSCIVFDILRSTITVLFVLGYLTLLFVSVYLFVANK